MAEYLSHFPQVEGGQNRTMTFRPEDLPEHVTEDVLRAIARPTNLQVFDFVASHPRCTRRDLVAGTGIPRGTLSGVLRALVQLNLLKTQPPIPAPRGVTVRYSLNTAVVRDAWTYIGIAIHEL